MVEYVVIDEHTLAACRPEYGQFAQILHASVLRGAAEPAVGTILVPTDKDRIRPATSQDFTDFNVQLPPDFVV